MRHGIKTLLLIFTLSAFFGCSRTPTASRNGKLYTIAFYNTENLYNTQNDPSPADDAYTPTGAKAWTKERYQEKLQHIAAVIGGIGGKDGPAVIGLSELENKQVLDALVDTPPLRKLKFGTILSDTPDAQGLHVALLYQPKHFKPTYTQQIGGKTDNAAFSMLQVKGELRGEPVTLYVVQWPTTVRNRKGKTNDTQQRQAAALLREQIAQQQAADKNSKIIVLGDFETEPRSPVMQQQLKATGRPDPQYQEELFNTHFIPFVNGQGSYASRGDFQMLDQVLISKSLLNGATGLQYVRGSAAIYDPDAIKFLFGKYKDTPTRSYSENLYLGGYSDHFPVYIKLRKEK